MAASLSSPVNVNQPPSPANHHLMVLVEYGYGRVKRYLLSMLLATRKGQVSIATLQHNLREARMFSS